MTELTETKLEIKPNGEHNNIIVKTKYKWDQKKKEYILDANKKKIVTKQGLPINTFVIVEKVAAEGHPVVSEEYKSTSYSCKVMYDGKQCSFWLNDTKTQPDHTNFAKCGGIGDKVKISCTKDVIVVRGEEKFAEVLHFEKVSANEQKVA